METPPNPSSDTGPRSAGEAIEKFLAAAGSALAANNPAVALLMFGRAEALAPAAQRIEILREMIPVHVALGGFVRAFEVASEVVEYYCADDRIETGTNLVLGLPDLGERDAEYRSKLEAILESHLAAADRARASWLSSGTLRTSREDFSRMRVLLVDDDPAQLDHFRKAVEPLGCEVVCASSGSDALARIVERRPSLVVCDLIMPGMTGNRLFERLQAEPSTATIPFVCVSAHADESEIAAAFRCGVEDFWTTPIGAREFQARVYRILRRIDDEAALSGSLAEIGVADLLQMLAGNGRTGVLVLESDAFTAAIYFLDGEPVDAVLGDKQGEVAVFGVVDWNEGRFHFSPRSYERPRRIFRNMQQLLVDAAYRLDESTSDTSRLPVNPATRLAFVTQVPALEMFPPEASLEDFGRLRWLVDGRRTLGDVLADIEGEIAPMRLLVALYEHGHVKDIGPAPTEEN